MMKELTENGKKVIYIIADKIPFLFPRRHRRVLWATSLPDYMVTKLIKQSDNQGNPTDVSFSALGWGCVMYYTNHGTVLGSAECIDIDGIKFHEYMPAHIRRWFGINELQALKIQSLNLNKQPKEKIAKLILEL